MTQFETVYEGMRRALQFCTDAAREENNVFMDGARQHLRDALLNVDRWAQLQRPKSVEPQSAGDIIEAQDKKWEARFKRIEELIVREKKTPETLSTIPATEVAAETV